MNGKRHQRRERGCRRHALRKALAELEQIVGKLESGNVPLEDSIKIYERGEMLKKRCDALLKDAEARVEKIALDTKGKPTGSAPLDQD
ncbi:MAG: exodeoxyribonuclease VII small subunit [Rhizobiales bacterium]|nr:exodeoxyribonuclease VII small subunit [Hyphomicrobiales bacterium]